MLLSTYVLCGFCRKRLIQKFWRDLLITSVLLDELSMDKRDGDGFFSTRLACRTNDRSCSSTDSSLVTVDYQQSLLALFLRKTADQARAPSCCILRTCSRVQLHMRILVVTLHVYSPHCTCSFQQHSGARFAQHRSLQVR